MAKDAIKYETYERLVRAIIVRVIKRYRGNFNEYYSEAMVLYAEAFNSYRPELGSFSNWLTHKVFRGLQETARTRDRRDRILREHIVSFDAKSPTEEREDEEQSIGTTRVWEPAAPSPNFAYRLLSQLSDESRKVVRLLFYSDIKVHLSNITSAKLEWRWLCIEELGYSPHQVTQCFDEIEEALSYT